MRPPSRVEVEIPGPEQGGDAGSGHARVPAAGSPAKSAGKLSPAQREADGAVTKLIDNGSTADRLDVVVIGDGYTAAELARFHADAEQKWAEVTAVEPYTTYRNLFNVWTVDAVSHDSGVSGDPDPATVRDTALGSYFWCEGIERLLCIDQPKVDAYVAKAPAADLVVVLANSAKYGGVATTSPAPPSVTRGSPRPRRAIRSPARSPSTRPATRWASSPTSTSTRASPTTRSTPAPSPPNPTAAP